MNAITLGTAGPSYLARLAALALVYFAAAKCSLLLAIPPGYATAVWPPSGIALAALLLCGARWWPGIWLGAALTNYSVELSVPVALCIATGNTLEALLAARLLGRLRLFERGAPLQSPEAAFLFVACAALASVVAASFGVAALFASGALPAAAALENWYTWWQGDAIGILVVTPAVLAWARAPLDARGEGGRRELALYALLFAAMLFAVFAQRPAGAPVLPVEFLAIAFFAWAGCRFDQRVATLSVLLASAFAVGCSVNRLGPFARESVNESLLLLQAFIGTGALVALVLCALLHRRAQELRIVERARRALEQAVTACNLELRQRVDQIAGTQALAHAGSWSWDAASGRLAWSDELCNIFGIAPGRFEGSLEAYLRRVHPGDRERVRALVRAAFFDRRGWDSVERIVRPDGTQRVLSSAGRVMDGEPARIVGVCIDVTERLRLQRAQEAQYQIALVLARAPSEAEALAAVLRAVCEESDWALGQYWEAGAAGQLRYAGVWPAALPPFDTLDGFVAHSRQLAAARGAQLPGEAWRDAQPVWYSEFARCEGDARAAAAAAAGLRSALAFKVSAGREVFGVIEFFAREPRAAEAETLEMAVSVGALLGEFLARSRAEQRLRRVTAQLG